MARTKLMFNIAWIAVLTYFVMQLLRGINNLNSIVNELGR